jgi:hypothetical protein
MRAPVLLLCAAALLLAGCAGYRLGPTNGQSAGARAVQIRPFVNHTPEAGMADEVTSALRRAVQQDGTFRLETQGAGDLVVTGVLKQYQRRELSLSRSDTRTVLDYQVQLTAEVTATETSSGRVLFSRPFNAGALLRVGDDLVSSERQALPQLARELARQVAALLADGEW